jgi:hypothetical protein
MATAVTVEVTPLGFTRDKERVALAFHATGGARIAIEFPVSALPQLGLLCAQIADAHSKETGQAYQPPLLPVWKWEGGAAPGGDIGLRFLIPRGGAYGFLLGRDLALSLLKGLQEALGFKVDRTQKPN